MQFAELNSLRARPDDVDDSTAVDDQLDPAPLMEGKAWLKLMFAVDSDGATLTSITQRSGMALRLRLPSGKVVLIPGTKQVGRESVRHLPALRVISKASGELRDYQPWSLCIAPDTPPEALLSPIDGSEDYWLRDEKDAAIANSDPLARARGLVAELLGLAPPSWVQPDKLDYVRARSALMQSEIVRVPTPALSPPRSGQGRHLPPFRYAIVLSDNALNATHRSVCLAAPLVPRHPHDDPSMGFFPLRDTLVNVRCGYSSVDLFGMRGFTRASATAHSMSPRLVLGTRAPAIWESLYESIRDTFT